jgi:hypothetical protein
MTAVPPFAEPLSLYRLRVPENGIGPAWYQIVKGKGVIRMKKFETPEFEVIDLDDKLLTSYAVSGTTEATSCSCDSEVPVA